MRNHTRYLYCSLACCFLFYDSLPAQQLKLGNHPSQNTKSAVLELESPDQGLLLTRVADTEEINAYSPPDGMIIYFTDGKTAAPYGENAGLYERKDDAWKKIQLQLPQSVIRDSSVIKFYQVGDSLLLNIPNASGSKRGVMSGGKQTFYGKKFFRSSITLKSLHPGSVLFVSKDEEGSTDTLAENNNSLFWDNNNLRLGIETNAPSSTLDVNGNFKFGVNGSVLQTVIHVEYNTPTAENISAGGQYLYDVPAAGVTAGASVVVSPKEELPDGLVIAYGFTSNGAVHIKIINTGSATVNVAAGTGFNIIVIQ